MSLRFGSVGLFLSLVAITYAAKFASDEGAKATRGPASIAAMHKEEIQGAYKAAPSTAIHHTEKLRGPLTITVENLSPQPQVGETFVLRGIISSPKDLTSAGFTWSIPKGVEVVNGQLTGTFSNVAAGETQVVEVTLRKLEPQNQQVHLVASAIHGDYRFGDSAQFNTDFKPVTNASPSKATVGGIEVVPSGDKSGDLKIFH